MSLNFKVPKFPKLKIRERDLIVAVVGILIGSFIVWGTFYIPNSAKPAWLPHDPPYDNSFAVATVQGSFDPSLLPTSNASIVSAINASVISGVPPTNATVQQFQTDVAQINSAINNVSTSAPTIAQNYSFYAPQNGVNASVSWNMIITDILDLVPGQQPVSQPCCNIPVGLSIVGGVPLAASVGPKVLASPLVSSVTIGYNAASKTFVAAKGSAQLVPATAANSYHVIATHANALKITQSISKANFPAASAKFTSGLGAGTLKWSANAGPSTSAKHSILDHLIVREILGS